MAFDDELVFAMSHKVKGKVSRRIRNARSTVSRFFLYSVNFETCLSLPLNSCDIDVENRRNAICFFLGLGRVDTVGVSAIDPIDLAR